MYFRESWGQVPTSKKRLFDREIYEAGGDHMGMQGSGRLNIYLKNGFTIAANRYIILAMEERR